MPEQPRQIFRQRSLERLAAPDRLDEVLHVVRPRAWIALWVTAIALAGAVAWSVLGHIPVSADGSALLTRPASIVPFQAPAGGVVQEVFVKVGQTIHEGQLLGTLDLPDLEQQIEQEELRLAQAKSRSAQILGLERELARFDADLLDEQRRILDQRIDSVGKDAEDVRKETEEAVDRQRANLKEAEDLSGQLLAKLEELKASYESLRARNDVSKDQIVDLESRMLDRQLRAKQLAVDAQELALREIVAKELFNRRKDLVADLRLRQQDIDVELAAIDRRLRVRELEDQAGIEEIERGIELLRGRLLHEGRIESRYDGRVLEVTTFMGERVQVGDRLGRLEIDDPSLPLMAVAYLRIADGKKTKPGARIVISPSTVERERHGGIVGEVVSVSEYAVTTLAVANQIGDPEIARALLGGESRIEVLARLEQNDDNPSGYSWTSGPGPQRLRVTAGTTAFVRATLEERTPISFVLPFLREASGM